MNIEQRKNFIVTAFDVLTPIIARLNDDGKILYSTKLQSLRERFYDPEFRLAVVGNFNCGKSTFLNALLKRRLLTTDNLPTTAIPTYIRWNKETLLEQTGRDECRYYNPIIKLTMNDGRVYTLTQAGKSKFEKETKIRLPSDTGAIIDTLTTTNALIDKIERVDLTFPARRGFDSFCLIDTPGINPGSEENKEHILQTQKVLREEADAVILLYPATQTMTRDTEEFMRDNAAHLMTGAIILLTKKDLIQKRELEKIVKYTARLVKDRFKQTKPEVYAISAQQAMDCFSGDSTDEEDLLGADDFNRTLETIISQLGDRRSEIVLRRISDLMRELIESISKTITADLKDLEEKRAFLREASAERLEEEFLNINRAYNERVSTKKNYRSELVTEIVTEVVNDRRRKMLNRIDNIDEAKELKLCLKFCNRGLIEEIRDEVLKRINEEIISEINQASKAYISKVAECLNKYKRYLGDLSTQDVEIKNENSLLVSTELPVTVEESFLKNHVGKIGVVTFALFGVIGLAFLAGAYFWSSKKFKAKREEAREEVDKNLENYKAKLIETCKESVEQTAEENLTWAHNLLKEYKVSYQTIFDEIEKKYNESINEVERQIIHNKKNVSQLEGLRKLLAEM